MEVKKIKEWAETANVFQGIFVLLGGAVSGRLSALTGAPLYAVIICCLLGMILFLLMVIFYRRNDPERAWISKSFMILVLLGAVFAVDARVSAWFERSLFTPEHQIRTWLDELHMKSELIVPPPDGQSFHFKVTNVKQNTSFIVYQEKTDTETIVLASLVTVKGFFEKLPENQKEKVWLDMGLALIRSDIKVDPLAKFGPIEVANWVSFGPQTTKQQFFMN